MNIDSKRFLKINFCLGVISLFGGFNLIGTLFLFIYNLVFDSDGNELKYFLKRFSNTDNYGFENDRYGTLSFIYNFLYFILYYMLFIFSYIKINMYKNKDINILSSLRFLFIGSLILHFGIYFWTVRTIFLDSYSNYIKTFCWVVNILLFMGLLFLGQKIVLNNYGKYKKIYFIMCVMPFLILLVAPKLTFLEYQFLFFKNNTVINSPWLMISLIFSPFSYLTMPLFFSFNHYIITKKLVMENTKEPLPENFYDFKFNYED
jgi:hypothetical protein